MINTMAHPSPVGLHEKEEMTNCRDFLQYLNKMQEEEWNKIKADMDAFNKIISNPTSFTNKDLRTLYEIIERNDKDSFDRETLKLFAEFSCQNWESDSVNYLTNTFSSKLNDTKLEYEISVREFLESIKEENEIEKILDKYLPLTYSEVNTSSREFRADLIKLFFFIRDTPMEEIRSEGKLANKIASFTARFYNTPMVAVLLRTFNAKFSSDFNQRKQSLTDKFINAFYEELTES